LEKSVDRIQ